MKNFIYSVFAIFLITNFNYAQINIDNVYLFNYQNDIRDQKNLYQDELIKAIEESEELKWQKAKLIKNSGLTDDVIARYNPISDAIEIKKGAKIFEILKRDNLKVSFINSGITYIAKSYYGQNNQIHTSFFITDSFSQDQGVFKRNIFEKKYHNGNHINDDIKNFKLVKSDVFYLIEKNHKLSLLTTNKRLLKKSFPNKYRLIYKYVKANKLNSNKEKDLLTLAEFIKNING